MHTYHDDLPGYDPRQIWFDGCPECEHRGQTVPSSIGTLDMNNLARAWDRTNLWCNDKWSEIGNLSQAELPLLRFLESVRNVSRMLGNCGIQVGA